MGNHKPQYDAETLHWCEERSFENMCLSFRDKLMLIHQGRYSKALLTPMSRRKMQELGILVSGKGRGQYNVLTEKAVEFLGFTEKDSQPMTKNTPPGDYMSSPKGQTPVPEKELIETRSENK